VALELDTTLMGLEDLLAGALRADIEYRLELADGLWRIKADPVQLELAMLKLALNARGRHGRTADSS